MNQPRVASDSAAQSAAKKKKSIFVLIQELKEELRKVNWTTKEELKLSTKVVVLSTLFLGFGIYLFDLVIKGALDSIAAVAHLIFG